MNRFNSLHLFVVAGVGGKCAFKPENPILDDAEEIESVNSKTVNDFFSKRILPLLP